MASNLLSHFLPPDSGERSVYETLLRDDGSSDQSDVEERAGLAFEEENIPTDYQDQELEDVLAEHGTGVERLRSPSSGAGPTKEDSGHHFLTGPLDHGARRIASMNETDGDVPQSLLFEDELQQLPPRPSENTHLPRRPQRSDQVIDQTQFPQQAIPRSHVPGFLSPKEQALWRWANVENLDTFLKDVYDYFIGNGIYSLILSKILNLLTLAFVVGFSTFLTSCVDYSQVPTSKRMEQIIVEKCTKKMSGTANVLIWLFALFWIWKVFQLFLDIRHLRYMQNFFRHLLDLSDADIQTVSWQEIVKRLMLLRDSNATTAVNNERHRRFVGSQSKQRMDAHDIANRLMRRDNYLIALVNKDILDLTLPVPFLRNRQLFSKTIEWSLSQCILDYVFNEHGQVRSVFLKDSHRRALSDGLKRRFRFAGVMNVLCAPFILVYFLMLYFFRYFTEYQKNPSQIGSRQYTPYAEWKFREFNELWHLFQRRSNMSYPFASRYIDQFPKDKTVQMAGFVAFIAGALASVLALASVIDPNLFLEFEITPERTVLFYLGIFGTVWAVARGTVPEESLVFDPEFALRNVVEYTHYCPKHWQGRLHSDEIRTEFAMLYRMKIVVFLEEMLSIIFTPLVLWFTLPQCSDRIIDFFREFTIHVDGLGYVCSFAVFDFKKSTNEVSTAAGKKPDLREDYYSTKDGKMLASYYGFIDNYVINQKSNMPYVHAQHRSHFHPPPVFPGLASSTIQRNLPRPALSPREPNVNNDRDSKKTGYSVYGLANQPSQRIPLSGQVGGSSSTMASVLLDPRHQPSQKNIRSVVKSIHQSTLEPSRKLAYQRSTLAQQHHAEDEESETEVDASHLGESWKTTRAGTMDDTGDDDESSSDHQEEPGVLGLVYQFSKAQTEGRGAGVKI